jgi:hypothetical protein
MFMQILAISKTDNYINNHNQIYFTAIPKPPECNVMSNVSKRLIQCMNLYIEETWGAIKSGKIMQSSPKYIYTKKGGEFVTVSPVYYLERPSILMEIDDGKHVDRIIIDRKMPDNVRYERTILTDHGSATVKSFNTQTGKQVELEEMINAQIEDIFPKIISKKILKEGFGKTYGYKKLIKKS